MDKVIQKLAGILIETGYAKQYPISDTSMERRMDIDTEWKKAFIVKSNDMKVQIDYMTDNIEARRQGDSIEDWLVKNKKELWLMSMSQFGFDDRPKHQWRLSRIRWCIKQL